MQHPRTSPRPGQASTTQPKNSPPQSNIPNSVQGMLKGLEKRFQTIYERVKELIKTKEGLLAANNTAAKEFETEFLSHEATLNILEQEITQLTLNNNELQVTSIKNRGQRTPQLVEDLARLNTHVNALAEQMETIISSLKKENTRTDLLEKQILYFKKEGVDVDTILKSPAKEKVESPREDDFASLPKYKSLLRKSNISSQANELDQLLNMSPITGKKIKNLEVLQERLKDVIEDSDYLQHENEKLRKKIMANMHSDYEKPAYDAQNSDREMLEHAKKQQKLRISKLFADEDKLISHINQHTKNGKITKEEDEYIKQQDAQNEENFRRILEIKELERLREQIAQQEAYISELERNGIEREHLLHDQKREIASLEDNLKNLTFDIRKNEVEKDLLDNKFYEKNSSLGGIRERYSTTVQALPEKVRQQHIAESPKISQRGFGSYLSKGQSKAEDDDLEDLLNMAPKALDLRKS